jgi:hypothetical protein
MRAKHRSASYFCSLVLPLAFAPLRVNAAEAQQFLGSKEIITDWPLRLVLDRRPLIGNRGRATLRAASPAIRRLIALEPGWNF